MGGNPMLIMLIFILPIGVLIWWFFKRKKKNSTAKIDYQKRRQEDEVWKTVKDWLKSKGIFGREIVECYVAKRLEDDVVDKKLSKEEQKQKRADIAKKKKDESAKKKDMKSKGLKYRKPLPQDLYVALFVTRNAKTKIEDDPKAIECSVITEKISKKETNRKIVVLRELDYEKEQSWIAPIKKKEEDEFNKETNRKIRNQKRFSKIKDVFSNKKSKADKLEAASDAILSDKKPEKKQKNKKAKNDKKS